MPLLDSSAPNSSKESQCVPHNEGIYTVSPIEDINNIPTKITEPKQASDNISSDKNPGNQKCRHFVGPFITLLAAGSFATLITIVNVLQQYDYFVVSIYRSVFIVVPGAAYLVVKEVNLFPPGKVRFLVLRSILGLVGSLLAFTCCQNLPVAESSTILQLTPVYVYILGLIFFKQKFYISTTLLIALCVVGVVLVANPNELIEQIGEVSTKKQLIGLGSGLSNGILSALTLYTIRHMRDVNPVIILTHMGAFGLVVGVVGSWVLKELKLPKDSFDFLLLCAAGITHLMGHICITIALRLEEAPLVSLVMVSEILFCTVIQVAFQHQLIHPVEAGGIALIGFALILVGIQRLVVTSSDRFGGRCKYFLK